LQRKRARDGGGRNWLPLRSGNTLKKAAGCMTVKVAYVPHREKVKRHEIPRPKVGLGGKRNRKNGHTEKKTSASNDTKGAIRFPTPPKEPPPKKKRKCHLAA